MQVLGRLLYRLLSSQGQEQQYYTLHAHALFYLLRLVHYFLDSPDPNRQPNCGGPHDVPGHVEIQRGPFRRAAKLQILGV